MSVFTLTKGAARLSFSFNGTQSSNAWAMYCSPAYAASAAPGACTPATGPVWINVTNAVDGSLLVLDETHFIWTNAPLPPLQGDYRAGQKGSIVELFGWPYPDIAEECALLAQYGYLGFKARRGVGLATVAALCTFTYPPRRCGHQLRRFLASTRFKTCSSACAAARLPPAVLALTPPRIPLAAPGGCCISQCRIGSRDASATVRCCERLSRPAAQWECELMLMPVR